MTNKTFPRNDLKRADKAIATAFDVLTEAWELVAAAEAPENTALGFPDRVKLEKIRSELSPIREQLAAHVAMLNEILETGGCGFTSEAARRESRSRWWARSRSR